MRAVAPFVLAHQAVRNHCSRQEAEEEQGTNIESNHMGWIKRAFLRKVLLPVGYGADYDLRYLFILESLSGEPILTLNLFLFGFPTKTKPQKE